MKARIRLKSFWRHNKCCAGMYTTFIPLVLIAMPPYSGFEVRPLLALSAILSFIWYKERMVDTYRRINIIDRHLSIKKQHEMHNEFQKALEEKDEELELITTKYHEVQKVIEETNKIKEEIRCHEATVTTYLISANRRIKRLRHSIAYKQRIHKMEIRQLISANHSLSSELDKMKSTSITPGMLTYDGVIQGCAK